MAEVALSVQTRDLRCPVGYRQDRQVRCIMRARTAERVVIPAELAVDRTSHQASVEQQRGKCRYFIEQRATVIMVVARDKGDARIRRQSNARSQHDARLEFIHRTPPRRRNRVEKAVRSESTRLGNEPRIGIQAHFDGLRRHGGSAHGAPVKPAARSGSGIVSGGWPLRSGGGIVAHAGSSGCSPCAARHSSASKTRSAISTTVARSQTSCAWKRIGWACSPNECMM